MAYINGNDNFLVITTLKGEPTDVSQTTGASETAVISQAGASRSFANAIKGEESGGAVLCEDVSPLLHPVGVKVRSANILPEASAVIGKYWETDGSGVVQQVDGPGLMCATQRLLVDAGETYIVSSNNEGLLWGVWFVNENNVSIRRTDGWQPSGLTFTVPTNCRYALFSCWYSGESYQNDIMVNKGSTALPYEPYVANGTAVKVESSGLNLFNKSTAVHGSICGGDGNVYANAEAFYSDAIPVTQGVTYSASSHNWYNFYTDNGSPSASNFVSQSGANTFTPPNGARFMRIVGNLTNLDMVMVNKGSTALPYEPYVAGKTIDTTVGSTIDLPSIAPYMSVYTNTEGTAVDVTYVKDTNAVVQKLVNAIVALGGNV